MSDEFVANEHGQFGVERRQDLWGRLDDDYIDTLTHKVLSHFEPDEPGSDHDRG